MKEIYLNQGFVALVDDEDYEEMNKHKWTLHKGTTTNYARRQVCRGGIITSILMHRFLMGLCKGDKMQVDHINKNGLDNRRENLRVCTHSENLRNGKRTGGTSKYRGVHFKTQQKKWCVQIRHNNKTLHLGVFDCEKEAARTYNKAAIEYHGEFATLNEIQPEQEK